MDTKFRIWSKNETPLHSLETPFQHLSKLVMEYAARARTAAACDTKSINKYYNEIDSIVTLKATKSMTKEDHAMFKTNPVRRRQK